MRLICGIVLLTSYVVPAVGLPVQHPGGEPFRFSCGNQKPHFLCKGQDCPAFPTSFVRLAIDGSLTWDGERIDRRRFVKHLHDLSGKYDELVILSDAAVPTGKLVSVLQMASRKGIERITCEVMKDR